jgi:hypothetical protein
VYVGLGIAPVAAVKIGLDLTQKLGQMFGHQRERVQKRINETIAQYNKATPPTSDPAALEWLYVKSGGRDVPKNNKYDLKKIKGWNPKDVPGSAGSAGLFVAAELSHQLRRLSYDLYASAAATQGKEPLPANEHLTKSHGSFDNIGGSEPGQGLVPTIERLQQQTAAAQPPKVQQAGFLGMDLGSPTTLASLGFVVLALILRER